MAAGTEEGCRLPKADTAPSSTNREAGRGERAVNAATERRLVSLLHPLNWRRQAVLHGAGLAVASCLRDRDMRPMI